MACDHCPCPESCLGWDIFCAWASEVPPDPVKLRHIAARASLGEHPAGPSPLRKAADLAGAVGRAVSAACRGEPVRATEAAYRGRLSICLACPENDAPPDGVRCKLCGCGGAKLALATERCPIGKWEAEVAPDGR